MTMAPHAVQTSLRRGGGGDYSQDGQDQPAPPGRPLWAPVVAERLDFDWEEALTLGRAVADLNVYAKGVSIGLFQPTPKVVRGPRYKLRRAETFTVDLLNRAVAAVHTAHGVRDLDKETPADPTSVQRYLGGKFKGVTRSMQIQGHCGMCAPRYDKPPMHFLPSSRICRNTPPNRPKLYRLFLPPPGNHLADRDCPPRLRQHCGSSH